MNHSDRLYMYAVSSSRTKADHLASAAGYIKQLEAEIASLKKRIEDVAAIDWYDMGFIHGSDAAYAVNTALQDNSYDD
jgi:lysozyme family protein